jgi:hypothetical protein
MKQEDSVFIRNNNIERSTLNSFKKLINEGKDATAYKIALEIAHKYIQHFLISDRIDLKVKLKSYTKNTIKK